VLLSEQDAIALASFWPVGLIAALTREHGGWEQARLRTSDERSRVQCLVPARGARRGKVLDEVSAAIPRDAVARNNSLEADRQDAGIC